MLVLTGKTGDGFMVDDGCVKILSVNRASGRIRLGFKFPPENTILRQKLYDAQKNKPESKSLIKNILKKIGA